MIRGLYNEITLCMYRWRLRTCITPGIQLEGTHETLTSYCRVGVPQPRSLCMQLSNRNLLKCQNFCQTEDKARILPASPFGKILNVTVGLVTPRLKVGLILHRTH